MSGKGIIMEASYSFIISLTLVLYLLLDMISGIVLLNSFNRDSGPMFMFIEQKLQGRDDFLVGRKIMSGFTASILSGNGKREND
jgi:hypothetical protein